jgi:small-conductance mechanosensitive channel/CRP-like cAMP-binding protein
MIMRLIPPLAVMLAASGLISFAQHWASETGNASSFLDIMAQVAIWLGAAWLVRRAVGAGLNLYSARKLRSEGAPHFLETGRYLLTDLVGLIAFGLAILGIVGVVLHQPITGLIATSGALAAVIGLAAQRMIADIFSGLALSVERPFVVGDWLEISSGLAGKIIEANWRAVRLVTIEGRAVVVPNSVLANNNFVNVSAPQRYFRLRREICIDYSVPGERALPILHAAMIATPGVRIDPQPIVLIDETNDRGVVYSLNFWVSDYPEQFPISRDVVITALRFLDQAGLVPAYPKRDITIAQVAPRRIERQIDLTQVLSRVPLLSVLDAEQTERLTRSGQVHELPTGAVIVREAEPGASLYIVLTGTLEVSRVEADGKPRTIARLLPGEVFGEMSLLTGTPRSATVTAASPVTLVEIRKEDFDPILRSQPALIAKLSEIEAVRLLANRNAAQLTAAEQKEIERLGFPGFMRRKIQAFFGHTA